ncbi:conserved hypothetical protein, partial [Ixodes scapularis]
MEALPFLEELVPYAVLLVNGLLSSLLRRLSARLVPLRAQLVASEAISTWELCSDVGELGIVYERHGTLLYALALLVCCLWWCRAFGDAEACPCGPVEDLLFGLGPGDFRSRLAGQLLGAVLTALYIKFIWSWEIIAEHRIMATTECQTSLMVIHLRGSFLSRVTTTNNTFVRIPSSRTVSCCCMQSFCCAISFLFVNEPMCLSPALTTTGGYFNPIMASALMLGCGGSTLTEHFTVYWVGALIGG